MIHAPHDPVLVVGAGPTGLVAALALAREGVPVRLVDRRPAPTTQSRATLVHARTLEHLDQFGLADALLARGHALRSVEIEERGGRPVVVPLVGVGSEGCTRFPCALSVEQHVTESVLTTALANHGVAVERGVTVTALAAPEGRDGVEVDLETGGRHHRVRAGHVVGADGASSTVRGLVGVAYRGTTAAETGLLADVELDADLSDSALRLTLTTGGFVGAVPIGRGRHRLFGAVPPAIAAAAPPPRPGPRGPSHEPWADIDPDLLRSWFEGYFGVRGRLLAVRWASVYRLHSRLASRYRVGRVLLAGDAAHASNPAGGQGMNLGIGDAVALAWRLAAAHHGHAGQLDGYEAERRPVAARIGRTTARAFRAETASHPALVALRAHVAPRTVRLLTALPPVRRAVFRLLSQTWIDYPPGSRRGVPGVGSRAPWAPWASPDDGLPGDGVLHVLRAPGHHLLVLAGPGAPGPASPALVATLAAARAAGVTVHHVAARHADVHRAYGTTGGRLVLLRPDGHVGAVASLDDPHALAGALPCARPANPPVPATEERP